MHANNFKLYSGWTTVASGIHLPSKFTLGKCKLGLEGLSNELLETLVVRFNQKMPLTFIRLPSQTTQTSEISTKRHMKALPDTTRNLSKLSLPFNFKSSHKNGLKLQFIHNHGVKLGKEKEVWTPKKITKYQLPANAAEVISNQCIGLQP